MHDFLIKEIHNPDMKQELLNIGFDSGYSRFATSKYNYVNLKIFDLSVPQANILKQSALSIGADCATHREVITGKAELTACILGGSLSQIDKIAKKIKGQPFGLKDLSEQLLNFISKKEKPSKTKLMGVLNLTENSFSDGGLYYEYDDAIKHLKKLIKDGADIIDIGAESTKPYSEPVEVEEQLDKLLPILKYVEEKKIETPISIDTRSSKVARICIQYGAKIINDVSGFDYDEQMIDVIAQNSHVKIILQHSLGTPENMQENPTYSNLMDEIYCSLHNKVQLALSRGIKKENIIIDPGIGFGKTRKDNFEILKRWQELKGIGCPVLIGVSRKSLLNMPKSTNEEKDIYTLALDSILISQKVDYLRVHNVKIHKNFLDIYN